MPEPTEPTRKRAKGMEWVQFRSFEGSEANLDFENYLATQDLVVKDSSTTKKGNTRIFKCIYPQCNFNLKALYPSTSSDIVMFTFESHEGHNPLDLMTGTNGVKKYPRIVTEFLNSVIATGVSGGQRLCRLLDAKFPGHPYDEASINNYVARNKVKVSGIAANITLTGFHDWCIEHSNVPEDLDVAFVVRLIILI
jgi:hypothetical protein